MDDFQKLISFKNLYKAYRRTISGKGSNKASLKFETMALEGIHIIKQSLIERTYKPSKYNEFFVYEPKQRLIKSGAFKDKIVQHCLCDEVLMPKLQYIFIKNNFAGQKNKGTDFALDTLKSEMLDFYNQNGMSGYILKGDITKYYYSINHKVLKEMIRQQFDDDGILWLCDLIIDSTEDDVGLPLGNQVSQVFGLLYLNGLDHYITEKLGIQFYGRYTDDFYILHSDKQYLIYCKDKIEEYLSTIHLSLNGKTQIMPFKQGIKFIGFHLYICNGELMCKLKNENRRNAFSKYIKMAKLVRSGKVNKEEFEKSLQSWIVHAQKGNCEDIIKNLQNKIEKIIEEGE